MELIRGLRNLLPRHRGGAATIGNFDGVHRGHQHVIARLGRIAGVDTPRTTVVAFEPTPAELFSPAAPARLTRFREKALALAAAGVQQFLCLRFDRKFAALTPDEFIARVLVEGLGVRQVVVGDDFRYGRDRQGDFESLRRAGARLGFDVRETPTFTMDGERVSSSAVRSALAGGSLQRARVLLGRPYSMCGRVIAGQKLGRELGFPTANIALGRKVSPLRGIFAIRARGPSLKDACLDGVASLGHRPTVDGDHDLLEVHLFDYQGILYGAQLEVIFLEKLRDEARFDSLGALKRQMHEDANRARHALARMASEVTLKQETSP